MPRQPRIDIAEFPQHIVIRGNNRAPCFFDDAGRRVFLKYLVDAARVRDCDLHAYVLMTNHVHILATAHACGSISRWIQDTGRAYVRYVNSRHERTGGLFEGRFRSGPVDSGRYFLSCMRYIETNPVRAAMVGSPIDYHWSSHAANLSGTPSHPITPHDEYLNLGDTIATRKRAYAALFDASEDARELDQIRKSLAMNRAVGTEGFISALGNRLGRDAGVVPRGRPKKAAEQKGL